MTMFTRVEPTWKVEATPCGNGDYNLDLFTDDFPSTYVNAETWEERLLVSKWSFRYQVPEKKIDKYAQKIIVKASKAWHNRYKREKRVIEYDDGARI